MAILEVKAEDCDLKDMIANLLRLLQPLADDKEITLVNSVQQPCIAHCDQRLTRQALINGLSNAIKYTQRGGQVTCRAEMVDGYAVATVEDNGIGIDDARIARVFEPFWQEGNSFVAENQGVGLGLTIARSYVETQGGRIEVRRAAERGTIFRITLPGSATVAPAVTSAAS